MNNLTVPHAETPDNPLLPAEQRKADLIALADFGARTARYWLARDALLALRREGLMTTALAHLVPTAVLNDPVPYLTEALRWDECWIVADAYDALRLESYGFPSLATEHRTSIPLDHLHGCRWVILLQRPGEEETLAGLDVRAELLRIGWAGTLTSITLPFINLDVAEAEFGLDDFGVFLANLISQGMAQTLAGNRDVPSNGGIRTIKVQDAPKFLTINGQEVATWRS